jgi:hypothetical protein
MDSILVLPIWIALEVAEAAEAADILIVVKVNNLNEYLLTVN